MVEFELSHRLTLHGFLRSSSLLSKPVSEHKAMTNTKCLSLGAFLCPAQWTHCELQTVSALDTEKGGVGSHVTPNMPVLYLGKGGRRERFPE